MKKEAVKNDVIANVTIPVSWKYVILIGKWIKKSNIDKAIIKLEKVKLKKLPLPCVTFNHKVSHKAGEGVAAGRYPVNTADFVIKTLNLIKANARHKGLDDSKLIINEFVANYVHSHNQRSKYQSGRLTHLKIGAVVEK